MIETDLFDFLDGIDPAGHWSIKVIGLDSIGANAVETLKAVSLPNVALCTFGALPEAGYFASDGFRGWLLGADILVVVIGDPEGLESIEQLVDTAREFDIRTIGLVSMPQNLPKDNHPELNTAYPDLVDLDTLIPVWPEPSSPSDSEDVGSDSKLSKVLVDLVSILTLKGCDNLDYADILAVLRFKGDCIYAMGFSKGESAMKHALDAAFEDLPQPDKHTIACLGLLFFIRAGYDLAYSHLDEAFARLNGRVPRDTHLLCGICLDKSWPGQVACTIMATGITPEYVGIIADSSR